MARPEGESMTPFEAELGSRLRAASQRALRSRSAADVAHRAMTTSPAGVLPAPGWSRAWLMPFLLLLGLLIVISGWLLTTGGSPHQPSIPAVVTGPSPTLSSPSPSAIPVPCP